MKKLLLLALFALPVNAMQLTEISGSIQQKPICEYVKIKNEFVKGLKEEKLLYSPNGFSVLKDNELKHIDKYDTSPELRTMKMAKLNSLLKDGYLKVNRMSNGDYRIESMGRVRGGGPVLAAIFYWTTKSICYAIPFAAAGAGAGAVVAATGGGAAPAMIATGAMAVGKGGLALGAIAGPGAATVASGITAVGGTAAAATATGAGIVASGGCLSCLVAGIELVSSLAGAVGAAIPGI